MSEVLPLPEDRGRAPRMGAWLRRPVRRRGGANGPTRLIEGVVLLLAGALLATATVNDLVRQTHINHRLDADLRTWRAYSHRDYHNLSVSQDFNGLSTREIVCGNTAPGGLKQRIQLCLVVTGPVRAGTRSVSGGWYLPPRVEDESRHRYGCFGPARAEGRCTQ
jgi:hypothetical protein